ncbi:TolA protein [Pseudomonas synxantha]|uniref:TolA protein n=1 Tax=Pseudomonas synxantha TaxID=47883 RepID=A0A3G7UBD9_9PSED|nr:hypothetical protein [Pseudomonas synxantha]AZE55936.1 TolA protein [Pseudomonas synxantha]
MSAQQQVITIDDISADNAPAIYVAGGLGQFFEAVKAEVTGEVPDLKTAKGRARIASLAATVSKSKAAVEKPGRDYLKRLKEMPKVVESELREFVTKMDNLRDATRQPLTEWENAEQARKDRHVDNIQAIKDLEVFGATPTAAAVAQTIAQLEAVELGDSWEEFLPEAAQAKDRTLSLLRAIHAERTQHEAEQAELVRLRAEAEAQAQRDRDAEIARAAAEQARIDAEQLGVSRTCWIRQPPPSVQPLSPCWMQRRPPSASAFNLNCKLSKPVQQQTRPRQAGSPPSSAPSKTALQPYADKKKPSSRRDWLRLPGRTQQQTRSCASKRSARPT